MSTQTVYFDNPASIVSLQNTTSTIQSQIGTTANQINTSLINLTGALYNMASQQFVINILLTKG